MLLIKFCAFFVQDFPLRDRLISRVGDHPKGVTRHMPVERDFTRTVPMICCHGLPEESLRSDDTAVRTQQKFDRPALLIDRSVKVESLSSNLHVLLVHPPRAPRQPSKRVPAHLELGNEALNPAPDC